MLFCSVVMLLAACRPASCEQLQCLTGQLCAYRSGSPECLLPCVEDAGTCENGKECLCAGSCPGCDDCVRVCSSRTPL